jgi:hypothetical protein
MRKLKKLSTLNFLICALLTIVLLCPGNLLGNFYTVVNTSDFGVGSFRAAIDSTNNNPGYDTIDFYIPGPGVHTIFPNSELPVLTDPSGVFINGLTQPGASIGSSPPSTCTLMIEIDGINAGPAHGIFIKSDNNRIQGMIINNFEQDGISIEAGPMQNTINNQIYWNIIGLDPTGMAPKGNGWPQSALWAGVRIHNIPAEITSIASDNFIVENLISSNYSEGVAIIGPQVPGDVFGNQIIGNYIGTDINGMVDLGNIHEGVSLCEGTHDNLVADNLISGNDYDGVGIQGYNNEPYPAPPIQTQYNVIMDNIIGLAIDMSPLGNSFHGVAVGEYGPSKWGCADKNTIGSGNIIAYNGGAGIAVWEDAINNYNADGNLITQNSIYDNNGLGIDLQNNGVTNNDPVDADTGPNEELNFPVIQSATESGGSTTITGFIDIDTDPTQAVVEVFKAKVDPTNYGEGEIYLGSTNPDASSNWNIVVMGLNPGDTVTATTTDLNNNTSEFCDIVVAQSGIEEIPIRYELTQNTPNPFSNFTTIKYAVPEMSDINLSVFDVSGRVIKVLASGIHSPSYYSIKWDGKDKRGERVSAGIYFYRLEAKGFSDSKKLIFFK